MELAVICPGCDQELSVSREEAGRALNCPSCGSDFELMLEEESDRDVTKTRVWPAADPRELERQSEAFIRCRAVRSGFKGDNVWGFNDSFVFAGRVPTKSIAQVPLRINKYGPREALKKEGWVGNLKLVEELVQLGNNSVEVKAGVKTMTINFPSKGDTQEFVNAFHERFFNRTELITEKSNFIKAGGLFLWLTILVGGLAAWGIFSTTQSTEATGKLAEFFFSSLGTLTVSVVSLLVVLMFLALTMSSIQKKRIKNRYCLSQ